jgi:hypothetical protein
MWKFLLLLLVLIVAFAQSIVMRIEAFDNTGALIQLNTSHVPTEGDVRAAAQERVLMRKEMRDLTGSD